MNESLINDFLKWIIAGGIGAVVAGLTLLYTQRRARDEDHGYMKIKLDCMIKCGTQNAPNQIFAKTSVENTSRRDIIIQAAYFIISESGTPYWKYFDSVKKEVKKCVDKAEAETRSKYYISRAKKSYDVEYRTKLDDAKKKLDDAKKKLKNNSNVKLVNSDPLKMEVDIAKEELELCKIRHKKGIVRKDLDLPNTFSAPDYTQVTGNPFAFRNSAGFYVVFLPYYYNDGGNVTLGSYEFLHSTNLIEKFFTSNKYSISFCIRGRWRNEKDYYPNQWLTLRYNITQMAFKIIMKLGAERHRFHYGENRFVQDEIDSS